MSGDLTSKPTLEDLTVTSEGGNDLDFQIHEGDFLVGITPANGGDSRWVSLDKSRATAIRDWLNKAIPAHEPSAGVKCTHCNGKGYNEPIYDEQDGWIDETPCETCNGSGRITTVEQYLKTLPANWHEDSSLETWFPITAEELKRLKDERASQPPSAGIEEYKRGFCAAAQIMRQFGLERVLARADEFRASLTKDAGECGACDQPGEHCANVHGICSRHGGRAHETREGQS